MEKRKAAHTLLERLGQVENFIESYPIEFERRYTYGLSNPIKFRFSMLKNLFGVLNIHNDIAYAPHTNAVMATMRAWTLRDRNEYADAYGEPVDHAIKLKNAYIDDILATHVLHVPQPLTWNEESEIRNFVVLLGVNVAARPLLYKILQTFYAFQTPLGYYDEEDVPARILQEVHGGYNILGECIEDLRQTYEEPARALFRLWDSQRMLSVGMAQHERLGDESKLGTLPENLLHIIAQQSIQY